MLARVASKVPADPEEFTIHKRGGKTLILELRAYPVQMQQEPVVLIIARDITRYRPFLFSLEHLQPFRKPGRLVGAVLRQYVQDLGRQ